jgi:hypothetical protein
MNSIRNLIALAVVALVTVVGFQSAFAYEVGEPVTNPGNQHRYMMLAAGTWDAANAEAIAMGGHLLTVNDAAEAQFALTSFGANNTRSLWTSTPGRVLGAMPRYGTPIFGVLEVEVPTLSQIQILDSAFGSNGHLYRLLSASSQVDAAAKAVMLGGHLVTIDDATESQFVVARFGASGTRVMWTSTQGRTLGAAPAYGVAIYGIVECGDANPTPQPAISVPAGGASTLGAVKHANLFSAVGADATPTQDAPVATKKISWGDLKARYR